MQFKIAKDQILHNWVVYRVGGSHEQHAHLKSKKGCMLLIKLIRQGTLPRSEYMQVSCHRLLSPEEMVRLKKPKDRYYNKPRG